MTVFRPCIDIHNGTVKQIVGSTLNDLGPGPTTNFVAEHDAAWYAKQYRKDGLLGGHVIKLGPGNDAAAKSALAAWPNGLQLGGGITAENARQWIAAGAEKVIVTSWLFRNKTLDMDRVKAMADCVGTDRLVIDLSCRRTDNGWSVATDRWQTITATPVDQAILQQLSKYCSEYLVHAADVEGKCQGIDLKLVSFLGKYSPIPTTYAGGGNALSDLDTVSRASGGQVDLTFGSALDMFGGTQVKYADCVAWNNQNG